ncbi:hypothetical protein DUNSADRAFT_375, partial [Dunaliella salina]
MVKQLDSLVHASNMVAKKNVTTGEDELFYSVARGGVQFTWPDVVATAYASLVFKVCLSSSNNIRKNECLVNLGTSGFYKRGQAVFAAQGAVMALGAAMDELGITTFTRKETAHSLK